MIITRKMTNTVIVVLLLLVLVWVVRWLHLM